MYVPVYPLTPAIWGAPAPAPLPPVPPPVPKPAAGIREGDEPVIPPKPLAEVKEEIRARLANDSVFKERENYLATLRKTAQIDEKL